MKHTVYTKKQRIISISLLVFLLLFGFIWGHFFEEPAIEEPKKIVKIIIIRPTKITQTVRLIGTVRAKQSTRLIAQAYGALQKNSQSGAFVKKDAQIARIINDPITKQLELAQSAQDITKDQYDRAITLQNKGVISKQNLDEKKSAWIESQNHLATSKTALDKFLFRAPFDGIVGTFLVREGTEIKEGTPVVTFYDPSNLVVEFDIPAPLLKILSQQPKVTIEGETYTLPQVQRMLDENTHMSPAEVAITSDKLIIGMPVDVDLCVMEKENIYVVPNDAVFLQRREFFVYVVDKNNKIEQIPVTIGIQNHGSIEILSGLETNDRVIIEGQKRLMPDMEVKIFNQEQETKTKTDAHIKDVA